MSRATKHRLPGIECPHCKSPASQRKANVLSELVRDIYFRCEDDDCGHHFVVQMAVTRTVAPSRKPNVAISLPFSGRYAIPPPANDDDLVAPPRGLS